jgi:hypothetical protein
MIVRGGFSQPIEASKESKRETKEQLIFYDSSVQINVLEFEQ